MKYDRSDTTARETRVVNDLGHVIGHVTQINRSHVLDVWVGFAHDWDGECVVGDVYDPIVTGVFDDPDSAYKEIERRAREAQAPEPCPGHVDDDSTLMSGAGIGEASYCDGSCQR